MSFRQLLATSPYRIRVVLGETVATYSPGILVATNWSISRVDGAGGVPVSVTFAFATDVTSLELALSSPLLDGIQYTLSESPAGSGVAAWRAPVTQAAQQQNVFSDPEAEALGVDYDWLAAVLDATGDMPQIRGKDCLANDLMAIALTSPGELFHRPTEGGDMLSEVNAPGSDPDAVGRRLRAAWSKDRRVKSIGPIEIADDGQGSLTASTAVQTVPLPEPLTIRVTT